MSFTALASPDLESGSARQAALLLHALRSDDRQWMLSRLPNHQRDLLMHLISELNALGIPTDHELMAAAKAGAPGATAFDPGLQQARALVDAANPLPETRQPVLTDTEFLADLDADGIARLAELLRREPPGLAVRLLIQRDWPWCDALVEALPAPHRQQVVALSTRRARTDGHLSALDKALLRGIRPRCEGMHLPALHASAEAASPGAPRRRGLKKWVMLLGGSKK